MRYIHELRGWPQLSWSHEKLSGQLASLRHRQGRLLGRMEGLGFTLQNEALLQTLTQDVLKSSEIEGESLDRDQVQSSIARRLGLDVGGLIPADRNVDGLVEMMLDATQHYADPLTEERLFGWHAAMFPTGRSGMTRIIVGQWRDDSGPMQVISGRLGREKLHYQAPDAVRLPREMGRFLEWFNASHDFDPVVMAGLAHLWFVTLHPFEDGNGRIARTIADMALARSEKSARRFYSMSSQIRLERRDYYDILEKTQKDGLDVTPWLEWFLGCLDRAFEGAEEILSKVLSKARFWQTYADYSFSDRQRVMINLLFDGVDGKMTSSKWAKLAKCSQDTALRDIEELLKCGVLVKEPGGGRSTSYALAEAVATPKSEGPMKS